MSPCRNASSDHDAWTMSVDGQDLPPCKGPKLCRFDDHHLPIIFVRLLSDPQTAVHSHVFEVKIGTDSYALKIFRYYDIEDDEAGLSDCELEDAEIHFYLDPFFAECRAFGRIVDERQNGSPAVECFGFVHLSAEREEELWERFEAGDWNRPQEEYNCVPSKRQPLRAIVKSLITQQTTWNIKTSRKILKNLRALNSLGVYVFDLRQHNIVGGQIADLSASWTEPHVLFETRERDEVLSRRKRDLVMFDAMMEELQIRGAPRALPNREYCKKLRSASRKQG